MKPTLTFRVGGLMSKVVVTSTKPNATIDDIIRVLKDAVTCAKAQKRAPQPTYPTTKIIHRIDRR